MRKLMFIMIVLSFCLPSIVVAALEVVGNLNDEMDGTVNQAGNWSYGWMGDDLVFHLMDVQMPDSDGVKGWNTAQGVTIPQIYYNGSTAYFWGAYPGEHACCPPSWEGTARYVVFRWIAPADITYNKVVLSGYGRGNVSNQYKKFTLFKNGAVLYSKGLWLIWMDFSVPDVDIAPGDVIYFAMDKNSAGSPADNDHAGVSYTISVAGEDPNEVWPDPEDPATDWDIQRDFRRYANPCGAGAAWNSGMGFDPIDDADFILYENHYTDDYGIWWWNHVGYASVMYKNPSGREYTYGTPPNTVSSHPGPEALLGYEYAKLRWISPIADTIQIVGSFGAGDSGAIEAWIVKDGVALLTHTPETTAEIPFDIRTEVVPGTVIDLVTGMGSSYSSESTPMYVVISRVDGIRCQDLPASAFLPTDFNKDCLINLEDFAALAKDWLKCNDPLESTCTDIPS